MSGKLAPWGNDDGGLDERADRRALRRPTALPALPGGDDLVGVNKVLVWHRNLLEDVQPPPGGF